MRWPEKTYIASERHGFLYVTVEKVACSSIRSWIAALEMGDESLLGREINAFVRASFELGSYSPEQAARILADTSLLRFAFVRNPWDRLVSGFVQKFVSHVDSPARHFVGRVERRRGWNRWLHLLSGGLLGTANAERGIDLLETMTFRQFVSELQHFDPASYDTHWRPQHLFLGGLELDFIGRFERMDEDFAQLCSKLGLGGTLPVVNRTPRGNSTHECLADWPLSRLRTLPSFPDYRQFYTADLVEQVAAIYAEDIRRFDYRFHGTNHRANRAA